MRRRDEVERLELGFVPNFKQRWPRIQVQDHHLALTDNQDGLQEGQLVAQVTNPRGPQDEHPKETKLMKLSIKTTVPWFSESCQHSCRRDFLFRDG